MITDDRGDPTTRGDAPSTGTYRFTLTGSGGVFPTTGGGTLTIDGTTVITLHPDAEVVQNGLVDLVAGPHAIANPRTVVVLDTSSAVLMPWLGRVAAVLEAWYGGQEAGTALAALLFGDADPSGRLPVTFPASDRQGPARTTAEYPGNGTTVSYDEGVLVGYRWYDATASTPLFSFGFGLSYTTFAYSGMTASADRRGNIQVAVTVTNTGRRTGAEVVQLYLGDPAQACEPPHQLKGYRKVNLRPGRSATVRFTLDRGALGVWDTSAAGWRVPASGYTVLVGSSSRDIRARRTVRIG